MHILVVGSGGREHALAWHFARTGHVVTVAPGNAGIARTLACRAPRESGNAGYVALARELGVDLVVVGPEQPLVDGLVDALAAASIPAFGPTQSAARLEGSKAFMKDVCRAAGVPTADFVVARTTDARSRDAAHAWLAERAARGVGAVVKADGLCAGKGVTVCTDAREAARELDAMLAGRFGAASAAVVVEDLLPGDEVSLFALCDGDDCALFSGARDHKRLLDGDRGPNTGGMGAVAPVDDARVATFVKERVVRPVLDEMQRRGAPFRGVLFCGLMVRRVAAAGTGPIIGSAGNAGDVDVQVLEFNVRFGDPETEALLLAMPMDLAPILADVAGGRPLPADLDLRAQKHSAVVVVASRGYPDAPEKGARIEGLDDANALAGARVFCAGVADKDGALVANGGRVLVVGATGDDRAQAITRAYDAVARLRMDGMQVRRDIGATSDDASRTGGT
jgi:phosphoribosylamine--glycine ligase